MGEVATIWGVWEAALHDTLNGTRTGLHPIEVVSGVLRQLDEQRWEAEVLPLLPEGLPGAPKGVGRPPKPPEERKDERVAFRLRGELADALDRASRDGESVHQAARRIVEEALARPEDPGERRRELITTWAKELLECDKDGSRRAFLEGLSHGMSPGGAAEGVEGGEDMAARAMACGLFGFVSGGRVRPDHADAVWGVLQGEG